MVEPVQEDDTLLLDDEEGRVEKLGDLKKGCKALRQEMQELAPFSRSKQGVGDYGHGEAVM